MIETRLVEAINQTNIPLLKGTVTGAEEHVIRAVMPGAKLGQRVFVNSINGSQILAEIAAYNGLEVKLVPLYRAVDIGPGDTVISDPNGGSILCGEALLGRVLNALGNPIDGFIKLDKPVWYPLYRPPPHPLARRPVSEQLITGIKVIDSCLAIGQGQRIGLFAGPGAGKSTLLGMLAKRAETDVCVLCLLGERGREVPEFIENSLGMDGLRRAVVVVASADEPPAARLRALDTAVAIAEHFREKGLKVLMLVDSLTRAVRAKREIAFALGEPAARSGYPSSAFSFLPEILERAGNDDKGSITAVYTVLTEDNDFSDPVAEEARSLLDGHIVLSEKRAQAGKWPAVDLLRSISRVSDNVVPDRISEAAAFLKKMESAYQENEDLILMGAYRRGTSKETDLAMDRKTRIEAFLTQKRNEFWPICKTFEALITLVEV